MYLKSLPYHSAGSDVHRIEFNQICKFTHKLYVYHKKWQFNVLIMLKKKKILLKKLVRCFYRFNKIQKKISKIYSLSAPHKLCCIALCINYRFKFMFDVKIFFCLLLSYIMNLSSFNGLSIRSLLLFLAFC